jgi:hypothetical protein
MRSRLRRRENRRRGYLRSRRLSLRLDTSGHYESYEENMFFVQRHGGPLG